MDVLDLLLREKEEEPDEPAETVLPPAEADPDADKLASCLLLAATVAALESLALEASEELIREEGNLAEEYDVDVDVELDEAEAAAEEAD